MKISKYSIIRKHATKDCYIAVNSLWGSVDYLSNHVGENLCKGNIDGYTPQDVNYLKSRGYIITDEFDEKHQLKKISELIHKSNLKKYRLSIAPTFECNFSCPYCFEKSIRETKTLTVADVDDIFHAVDTAKLPFSKHVFLFGGEPLMKKNKDLLTCIVKHCKARSMRLYGSTNGYDLHYYQDLLGTDMIYQLQVTIDGLKEKHNETRVHKEGQITFDRIVANIDECLKNGIQIIARTNVMKDNLSVVNDLIEFYNNKGWANNSNFNYAFSPVLYKEDSLSYKEFYDNLKAMKLSDSILVTHISQYTGIYKKLTGLIENEKLVLFQPENCASCYNNFFVGPDRRLYPCGDLLNSNHYCGTLEKDKFVFNQIQEKWNLRYVMNMTRCTDCAYALYCGGGCTARCIRNNISIFSSLCESFPQIFDQCLTNIDSNKIPRVV